MTRAKANDEKKSESVSYQPCPECKRGHLMWVHDCEKCSECGREFDGHGIIVVAASCERDLDGWGRLC